MSHESRRWADRGEEQLVPVRFVVTQPNARECDAETFRHARVVVDQPGTVERCERPGDTFSFPGE